MPIISTIKIPKDDDDFVDLAEYEHTGSTIDTKVN